MTEVFFYHLERRSLESALPELLEKCVERSWRTVVQVGSGERMAALDSHLWTYSQESFLAHGTEADGNADLQPVFLTTGPENPGGAVVRFLVDRAEPPDFEGYRRVVFVFDGRDEEAVAQARGHWKAAMAAGHECMYQRQDDNGAWIRQG